MNIFSYKIIIIKRTPHSILLGAIYYWYNEADKFNFFLFSGYIHFEQKNFIFNTRAIPCNFFTLMTVGHQFRSTFDRAFVIRKQICSQNLGQKNFFWRFYACFTFLRHFLHTKKFLRYWLSKAEIDQKKIFLKKMAKKQVKRT